MANYVTTEQVRVALVDQGELEETILSLVAAGVTSWIDAQCGRNFNVTTSEARYFDPTDAYCVQIDDAATVTAVATDDAADGTYSTSWSSSDWQAQPVGGHGPAGQSGWPFRSVVAVNSRTFYKGVNRRPVVKVTGTWGWSAVPADIKVAALMVTEEMYKAVREAPFGTAGLSDFGPITIRGNRRVQEILQPYKRMAAADGRFLVA